MRRLTTSRSQKKTNRQYIEPERSMRLADTAPQANKRSFSWVASLLEDTASRVDKAAQEQGFAPAIVQSNGKYTGASGWFRTGRPGNSGKAASREELQPPFASLHPEGFRLVTKRPFGRSYPVTAQLTG